MKGCKFSLLVLIGMISLNSCTKKWPDDAVSQLKNSGAISQENNMVDMLSGTNNNDNYYNCVIEMYKSNYPNYADFEKAISENPNYIKSLRVKCIKQVAGSNFDNIWNLIENDERMQRVKAGLEPIYWNKYKALMMSKLRYKYKSMDNLINILQADEYSISQYISTCDEECGRAIMLERQQQNLLQTLQSSQNQPLSDDQYQTPSNNQTNEFN